MNKKKAAKKKLATTLLPDIKVITTAGGLRIFFSAAAYELMKENFLEHVKDKMDITLQKDKRNLTIITTTRIAQTVDNLPYTINWYHTKCSLLVNAWERPAGIQRTHAGGDRKNMLQNRRWKTL